MAHITKFSINGLAGRDDLFECKLNRNINVIYGLNGSGKSSLLKILHSAMSGNTEILNNVPFKDAEVNIYSIEYDTIFTYKIQQNINKENDNLKMKRSRVRVGNRVTIRSGSQIDRKWSISPKLSNDQLSNWVHQYLPTSRLYLTQNIPYSPFDGSRAFSDEISEEELDKIFSFCLLNIWSYYSSSVLSLVRQIHEKGLADILSLAIISTKKVMKKSKKKTKLGKNTKLRYVYERLKAFLKRKSSKVDLGTFDVFKKKYLEDESFRKIAKYINIVEQDIENTMAPRIRFENLINQMFTGNKNIIFDDKKINVITKDKQDIGLTNLSSGEKHLMKILIEALMVKKSSLLIDEPELSLHIDWQRDFISALNHINPECQLICATHSPEIMANLPNRNIFNL